MNPGPTKVHESGSATQVKVNHQRAMNAGTLSTPDFADLWQCQWLYNNMQITMVFILDGNSEQGAQV